MRTASALAALACLGALVAAPARAEAQTRTITCESRGDDRHECYVANLDQGSVYVDQQLSKSDCDRNDSWGTSRDKIWVSRGCRAVFSYRTGGSGSYAGGGSLQSVTCESRGDDRHECYVANLDQGSVYLSRKLSQSDCDKFESWGTSRDKIWVSRGCRAVFSYRTGGGNYGGGSGNDGGGLRTITCESRDGDRKECYVANLDDQSVTMDKLLSETLCQKGRNWDASGNVIWVKGGCRARFNYVTRGGGNYGNSYGGGSQSAARDACLERASREWAVTKDNLEIKGTNRLDNGQTEVMVASKRTSGSCYVSSSGRVQRFSTY
jgi:hypothetical protein